MEKHVDKIFIEQLSKLSGLTPSALAVKSGLTPTTLNRLTRQNITATHKLSMKTMEKLSVGAAIPLPVLLKHHADISLAVKNGKEIPSIEKIRSLLESSLQPQVDGRIANLSRDSSQEIAVPLLRYEKVTPDHLILDFSTISSSVICLVPNGGTRNIRAFKNQDKRAADRYELGELVFIELDTFPLPHKDCLVVLPDRSVRLVKYIDQKPSEMIFMWFDSKKNWSLKTDLDKVKIHAVVGRE